MDKIKLLINEYHYGKSLGFKWFWLCAILNLASVFYFLIINTKNFLYKIKLLKEKKVKPVVICVGNLTTGGVGKTPVVCEIANYLANTLKKKTAVISRGYGAKLDNKKVNVIKDNENKILYTDGAICGDEALLSAKNTNNVIVLTCRDRVKAAQFAANNFGAEVVVLDDGFSNRKIKKDFTILVADSKKWLGNERLLPAGPLREPKSETNRADFFVVVNKENKPVSKAPFKEKLKSQKVAISNVIPDIFYNIKNGLTVFADNSVAAAFCAIGQPEGFYDFLNNLFDVKFKKSFLDHHNYTTDDIKQLVKSADEIKTKTLITTQKDEVKVKPLILENDFDMNFLALKLKIEFDNPKLFEEIKKLFPDFK